MKTETYETKVQGMICRRCEDIVTARLAQTRGVVDAGASYWKSRVTVEYDPDIITPGDIDAVLERSGYPAGDGGVGGIVVDIICLAAMVGLFFLFKYLPAQVSVPKAQEGAALGFIFVIGLLTSTHCIGMCGGIMLSQTTDSSLSDAAVRKKRGVAAALSYNGGRVFTSTAAGAVFGAIGAVITYTMTFKSIVFTMAGAVVLIMGLGMWGIIPALRVLSPSVPGACELPEKARRRFIGKPLIVGLLTGVMPCGASYAMWVYSMGTGSAGRGALTMLAWSLGTVPLMFVFGSVGAFIPAKYSKWMVKISAVFVAALGLLMLTKGIKMA
jgi:sulfite exporter TauE/SafE/copper chaperone CopZ